MHTKKCPKCNEIKDIDMFGFRKTGSLIRVSWCKKCAVKYSGDRYKLRPKVQLKNKYNRWAKKNRGKCAARLARYKAAKLQRTPPWLTEDHNKEIVGIYELAKELQWLSEAPLEIDHIEPLQGEHISGLHVPWNLQILPKPLNCSKKNKKGT